MWEVSPWTWGLLFAAFVAAIRLSSPRSWAPEAWELPRRHYSPREKVAVWATLALWVAGGLSLALDVSRTHG